MDGLVLFSDAPGAGKRPVRPCIPCGYRLALALILVAALWGGRLAHAPRAAAQDAACFAETNQCIRGRFLAYWQQHGGLALNGYPLTGERQELLEDGKTDTVQYFERVRMEYHPENQPPYDVLLALFGRRAFRNRFFSNLPAYQAAVAPAQPVEGETYFPETGHNVGPRFMDYWRQNGGLAQFGYPLGEELKEPVAGVGQAAVQYFERARFEWHPENPPPYNVLLGQFGRDILTETGYLSGSLGVLYTTDERIRERLGAPQGPAAQVQGAVLEFERGRMLYQRSPNANSGTIYGLRGDMQSGEAFPYQRLAFGAADRWDPSQPEGGGPGPVPGLFVPKRGFGTFWDLYAGRDRLLGYATAPDETVYPLTAQRFLLGVMLSTPDGQAVYVLWAEQHPEGGGTEGNYERVALPAPGRVAEGI